MSHTDEMGNEVQTCSREGCGAEFGVHRDTCPECGQGPYWAHGRIKGSTDRNGVTTLTVQAAGRKGVKRVAMITEQRDRGIERHILPALRRLGGGRYPALEDALERGAVPAAVARDLFRLLRQAEDKATGARRDAMRDLTRGRLR